MKSSPLKKLLLEALAVLVGILAAVGVDAAWQARSDAERKTAYVEALRTEAVSNKLIIEDGLAALDDEVPIALGFYTSVVTANLAVPDDRILTMLFHMGPRPLELERLALTDLSSGGLEFMDSSELRRAVAQYERSLNEVASGRESLQIYFEREFLPYLMAHASLPDMFNGFEGVFLDYDFPEGDFPLDTSAFVENRTFANLFANYFWHIEAVRRIEARFVLSVDELVASLAGRSLNADPLESP